MSVFQCPGCGAACRVSRNLKGEVISYAQVTHDGEACSWATERLDQWLNHVLADALGVPTQGGAEA